MDQSPRVDPAQCRGRRRQGEECGFEIARPNVLGRRGWSKKILEPGDRISITYHPMRDGSHGGAVVSVTFPSGKTVVVQFT